MKFKKILLGLILIFGLVPLSHSLTLSEIRDQIRIRIKDSSTSRQRYTNAQLNALINEAQRDVTNITWEIENTTFTELAPGTTAYSIPSNIIEIKRVTLRDVKLKATTLDQLDAEFPGAWERTSGLPTRYWQTPGSIKFYPFPNNSNSTGTVKILYYAQATDLSSDSDIPFGGGRLISYHDVLILYPCYKIFLLEGDAVRATTYFQEYESRLVIMRSRIGSAPDYNPGVSGAPK